MAKTEPKTRQTETSVEDFLNEITDENVRNDSIRIAELMEKVTSEKPKMWGTNIVGFGSQTLKYESGREQDWMEIGFSPRKANLTLYLNWSDNWDESLLSKLGKHKTGKGCLYFKKISDIDEKILEELIKKTVDNIRN